MKNSLEQFPVYRFLKVITLFLIAYFWLCGIMLISQVFTHRYHDTREVYNRYGQYIKTESYVRYNYNFGEWRYVLMILAMFAYTGLLALVMYILPKIANYVVFGNDENISEKLENSNEKTENISENIIETREETDSEIIITKIIKK